MKVPILHIVAIAVLAIFLQSCSGGHADACLEALKQTQHSYNATAGKVYPRIAAALMSGGANATAVMSTLGATMQEDYSEEIDKSKKSLAEAKIQFSKIAKRQDCPDSLKTTFATYSRIIEDNELFFCTSAPLSLLQQWFNDYPHSDRLYQELAKEISKLK